MKRTKLLTLLLTIALVIICAAFSSCGANLAASAGNIGAESAEEDLDSAEEADAGSYDEEFHDDEDVESEDYDDEDSEENEENIEESLEADEETLSDKDEKYEVILNNNPERMRYHMPECRGVDQISEEHYEEYKLTKEEIKEKEDTAGWIECGWCHPKRKLGIED